MDSGRPARVLSQSLRPPRVHAGRARREGAALDESLSEAHATLGQVLFTYEWKREEGLRELRRAIELNPNNQNARHWYAMAHGGLGLFDASLELIERALAIDPLAVMVNANVGFLLYRAGRSRRPREAPPTSKGSRVRDDSLSSRPRARAKGLYGRPSASSIRCRPSATRPLALTAIARRPLMAIRSGPPVLTELLDIAQILRSPGDHAGIPARRLP